VHGARDRLEVALPALLEEQREEVDLEEEVAELVEQLLGAAADGGVRDLVRLLDGVRDDRPRRLLTVPRALAAQPLGQLLELEQRGRETARGTVRRDYRSFVSVCVSSAAVVAGGA